MIPTKVSSIKGHDHPISAHLIVIGSQPIEATVDGNIPQIAKRFRCIAARLIEPFGVSLAHVQFAIGGPSQTMQSVLQIPKIGIDLGVIVRFVVAIHIANHGQVGSVGDPQVATMPGPPLNRIETGCEHLGRVCFAVAVGVEKQHDAIARCVRFRTAILWPHADKQSSPLVKRHRTRLTY